MNRIKGLQQKQEPKEKSGDMKKWISIFLFVLLGVPAFCQPEKFVILSPKSTVTTAQVVEGFAKSCPNVHVTENAEKADYILEAAETDYIDKDGVYPRYHFALLSKNGDVLMTTHPKVSLHHFKHHFDSVCKYINGK